MPEVTHVSPLGFGPDGMWGGGERYALELARAMSRRVDTKLVVFGPRARRLRLDRLAIEVLPSRGRHRGHDVNPVSELLPLSLGGSRVLHAHQLRSVVTDATLAYAALRGRDAFVTDHGGRGRSYSRLLRLDRGMAGLLAVSRFSASLFPELAGRSRVVYGGVDTERFRPGPEEERQRRALFVGRLHWYKGVDVAVRATGDGLPLDVMGPAYDEDYRAELDRLAAGKPVEFHEPPAQHDLVAAYRRARAFVLPSVVEGPQGRTPGELFPLVVLEALACGTPVVCTDTGGMPEAIRDGETGFVVPPNDPDALRERLRLLLEDDALWRRMSAAAVETVRERFTWDHVAERCLDAYADARRGAPAPIAARRTRPPGRLLLAAPRAGGVGAVAERSGRELERRGWQVEQVRIEAGGVPALRAVRALVAARGWLLEADVVHAEFGATDLAAFWFALGATLIRRDTVVVAHDLPDLVLAPATGLVRAAPGWRDAFAHRVLAPVLDGPLRRLLTRRAAVGVTLSERAGSAWPQEGPASVAVLEHGAEPPTPGRLPPSRGKHVLFAGHLTAGRGLEQLLETWERVGPGTELPLVIAGGLAVESQADWAAALQARSDRQANPPRWLGRVDDERFAHLFSEAAVVVIPYLRSNPASGIVVRAAVEGRAIVATRVPAAEDVLLAGRDALLVPPGDVPALTAALERLLADPELRDRLGASAGGRTRARHTWPRHAEHLEAAYAQVGEAA